MTSAATAPAPPIAVWFELWSRASAASAIAASRGTLLPLAGLPPACLTSGLIAAASAAWLAAPSSARRRTSRIAASRAPPEPPRSICSTTVAAAPLGSRTALTTDPWRASSASTTLASSSTARSFSSEVLAVCSVETSCRTRRAAVSCCGVGPPAAPPLLDLAPAAPCRLSERSCAASITRSSSGSVSMPCSFFSFLEPPADCCSTSGSSR